jgi:starvation-inducible outer membrane lipoprotein
MKLLQMGLLILAAFSISACSEVPARQRGNLALPQMSLTPDALEFGLRQHTAFSKEAGSGGYGGTGGGCGCN